VIQNVQEEVIQDIQEQVIQDVQEWFLPQRHPQASGPLVQLCRKPWSLC
jgi:hypothetical protein